MRPKPIPPQPGQESVWDYPRPPRIEATSKHIEIIFNGEKIVDTCSAKRVLETSHPPTYYIPMVDIKMEYLQQSDRTTFCEWKGSANYYHLIVKDRTALDVAWGYKETFPNYEALIDHIAFYPRPMDACYVDGEIAIAQPGDFYAGWITQDIVGPFKGEPNTRGW